MIPNPSDCDRESKGSYCGPSPTQKHRRGKTGKARKKRRHWNLFSRWKTSESEDDDDLELYRWSKSRGLTARILPPQSTQPNESTQKVSRMRYHDYTESKSTANQRTNSSKQENVKRVASANTIAALQEGIFLAKLCPSIRDKKYFVEQSKKLTENEAEQSKNISADKNVVTLSQKQVQRRGEQQISSCKGDVKDDKSVAVQQNFASSPPLSKEQSLKSTADATTDEKNAKPSIEMKNDTPHSGRKSASSPDPTSTSSSSPPPFQLSKKEWSASVESDILRLYESTSTIQTNTNLVYSWSTPSVAPAPIKQSSIPQTVERKIEQAEYTPSYVQMLAKMFRNRMQIRKEREERVEENLRKNKLSFDCVGNGTYSSKSDSMLPKTTSYTLPNPNLISRAHLRYRHLGDSKESSTDRLEITQTIRIDQLDVGYTHGRYSKALKYNPERNLGKAPTANGNTLSGHTSDESVGGRSSSKKLPKGDDKSNDAHGHRGFFKLYDGDPSAKLQKPTPHLTPFKHPSKHDTKSTLLLAKKARKGLSYSKKKANDTSDVIQGNKTGVINSDVNELFEYRDSPVRWSTSVGSLYCRPPARILSRPAAQKV